MYKYIITAIILLPLCTQAQDKAKKVKCTVTDAITTKAIKGVFAIEHGNDDTVKAAANGVFQVSVTEAIQMGVYAPGYEDQHILVAPDTKCSVQLKRDEDADDVEDEKEAESEE